MSSRADSALRAPGKCQAPDCGATTRHNKPYCWDHLDLLPYVARIAAKIEIETGEITGSEHPVCRKVLALLGYKAWIPVLSLQHRSGQSSKRFRLALTTLYEEGLVEIQGPFMASRRNGKVSHARRVPEWLRETADEDLINDDGDEIGSICADNHPCGA